MLISLALIAPVSPPAGADEADPTITHHTVATADDVMIAISVFQPAEASATNTAPLIFQSHGWGGTRATTDNGIVAELIDAGYGVLSFDARGHGDSTGLATIHHKDSEIQDVIKLLDWAYDNLDWVTKQGAPENKDLLLGAVGGSYGGAYQLITASYDDRFDALVPQMTWNDLRYSLAPGDVLKSAWVDALYGLGAASIDMDPRIHEWFWTATATNQLPQAALDHLAGSNPIPANINAAVLLYQGVPDLLFNVNEALANYYGIEAHNSDVALITYNGGHVLPGVQPIGFMGPSRDNAACGSYNDQALAWFNHHLLGQTDVEIPSGVSFATDDGTTCVQVADPRLETNTRTRLFDALPVPNTAGSILIPLDAGTGTLAGIPHLEATFIGATESIFATGLVKMESNGVTHIVDDQSTPLRIQPALGTVETTISIDLAGVVTELESGDQLFLRIDALNEWYFSSSGRTPGGGVFVDVQVDLPFLAEPDIPAAPQPNAPPLS